MPEKLAKGKKIAPARLAAMDPSARTQMVDEPPDDDELSFEAEIWQLTQCPWCCATGYLNLDTAVRRWCSCSRCGQAFEA